RILVQGAIDPRERLGYRVEVAAPLSNGVIDWDAFEAEARKQVEKAIQDRKIFFDQMPGLVPHLVRRGLLAPVAAAGAWTFATLVLHDPGLGEVFAGSILGSYAAGGWGMYRGRRLDFANRQAEKDDRRAALGLPRG